MKQLNRNISDVARKIKREFPKICRLNEPLASYTTYQVGGPADAFVVPENIEQLEQVVRICGQARVPCFILGKGANILIHDEGFRGVVVALEKCCNQLFHEDELLYVGTGVTVQSLVEYCEENGLGGLEYMSGIPGTVGGALTMNAGAFVGEIGDRVIRVDALNEKGQRVQISKDEAQFGYRRADGLSGKILLGCWIVVELHDPKKLAAAREEYLERRARRQPLEFPSCGSVFKRPEGDYAGRLIETAGAKGMSIGGAKVSEKHANFILNFNRASARDIYELIRAVRKKVYDSSGIWLEPEVKFVGFSEEERNKVLEPDEEA